MAKATRDIYQEVSDKILTYLHQGTPPWRQPILGKEGVGFPSNLSTGKAYRGINVFILGMTAWMAGYSSGEWLTFKQCREMGGRVRKGEKSSLVTFWKLYEKTDDETGEVSNLPVLRHYNVFNVDQCDGVEPTAQPETAERDPFVSIEACQAIVDRYRSAPEILHGGLSACYVKSEDRVKIAEPEKFESDEAYYATLFHELAHSTGHETRLNRDTLTETHVFGSPSYTREELVAEMGSAFLCAHGAISPPTIEQSAAYIEGWRKKIGEDKKLVIQAAGAGQRAVDLILGQSFDQAARPPPAEATNTPAPATTPARQLGLF